MPPQLFKCPCQLLAKKKIPVKELPSSSSVPRSTMKLADGNTIAIVQRDCDWDTHTTEVGNWLPHYTQGEAC